MINELKAKLEKLTRLEEIASHAEADYEREPENREYEETFYRAYQNEHNTFMEAADLIVKMTNGQIDEKTARTIVRTKRNEIVEGCTIFGGSFSNETALNVNDFEMER